MKTTHLWLRLFTFSLSLMLMPALLAQEEPAANTPLEIAEIYCKAITSKNSEQLLSVIHEESGKHLGESILNYVKELHAADDITLSHQLFGRSLEDEEIAALTWQEALARYLCGPATNTERRHSSGTWSLNPNWLGGLGAPGTRKVVGVIHDKINEQIELAHVVYRFEGMNPRPHEDFVNLVTCFKDEEEQWKIGLPWKMQIDFIQRVETLKLMQNLSKQHSDDSGDSLDNESRPIDR